MKISSRSILSPGRDPVPISLQTSLSRRLRTSRSIKGGASPAMFPATAKKRGCGFENPEPSSPKVTCIGQVRVKSKKNVKNVRTLSRRQGTGELSFRKLEHSNDGFGSRSQHQRWVHLPLTICEALRAFGSEFSCLFPCRSSCSSSMHKEEKMGVGSVEGGNRQGSCGAVLARWLVALQDGDGDGRRDAGGNGGGREFELAAGDDEEEEELGVRNLRRHVFQDLEIINDSILGAKDEARVSICVPPKNALLLMRCGSDPMKMEALANRFWEPTMDKNEEEDEEFIDDEEKIEDTQIPREDLQLQEEEKSMPLALVEVNDQGHDDLQEVAVDQEQVETNLEMETKQSIQEEDEDEEQIIETNEEDESMNLWCLFEENADENQELEEEEEADSEMEDAQEELFEDIDAQETEARVSNIEVEDFEEKNEKGMGFTVRSETPNETHEEVVMELENAETPNETHEEVTESEHRENEGEHNSRKALPECLLLMMYEPKLSMEVSKETWVCSTDFIRGQSCRKKPPPPSPPPVILIDGQDESSRVSSKEAAAQSQLVLQQPARSSCSYPAPPSTETMLDPKLGLEPWVLTRCKSEPMRSAAAKPVQDTGFWENKTLEPLRRASFSIGMAGLEF